MGRNGFLSIQSINSELNSAATPHMTHMTGHILPPETLSSNPFKSEKADHKRPSEKAQ
ncbi:MAG: hypothetical protein VYA34_11475 [Myxococcota bacterium]|nr:hypothetical protein [Myxococcota bacterium]